MKMLQWKLYVTLIVIETDTRIALLLKFDIVAWPVYILFISNQIHSWWQVIPQSCLLAFYFHFSCLHEWILLMYGVL